MSHVFVNGPASWNTLVEVESLPGPVSQTVFASGYRDGLGGTSAGKAVSLAALGVDVVLRTILGDDEPGALVRAALTHERIRLETAEADGGRSERHLNLMAADGGRLSIYLELPHAPEAPDTGASLHGAAVAVLDLAASSIPLIAQARALGVPVWCDVHDDDGKQEFQRPFADGADVVVVSESRLDDPNAYLRDRVSRGARLAVCTRGSRGALALDEHGFIEVGTAPVDVVVDTNGAGDGFVAGMIAAHLAGGATLESLALGAATGAIAVTTTDLGARTATPEHAAALARRVEVRRV